MNDSEIEYEYFKPRPKKMKVGIEKAKDLSPEAAYETAVVYLNMKMYSRGDLLERLKKKGFAASDIDTALHRLEQEGLVDDKKYAEIYLQNMIEYKTYGYYGIRIKLLQKKLDKPLIDQLLRDLLTPEVERTIVLKLLAKSANAQKSKEQLIQSMRQKGFRTDVILKAFDSQ